MSIRVYPGPVILCTLLWIRLGSFTFHLKLPLASLVLKISRPNFQAFVYPKRCLAQASFFNCFTASGSRDRWSRLGLRPEPPGLMLHACTLPGAARIGGGHLPAAPVLERSMPRLPAAPPAPYSVPRHPDPVRLQLSATKLCLSWGGRTVQRVENPPIPPSVVISQAQTPLSHVPAVLLRSLRSLPRVCGLVAVGGLGRVYTQILGLSPSAATSPPGFSPTFPAPPPAPDLPPPCPPAKLGRWWLSTARSRGVGSIPSPRRVFHARISRFPAAEGSSPEKGPQ